MSPTAQYEPAPDVLLTDLTETETCLLNTRTLYYYALNETARLIWDEVAAGRTPEAAAAALHEAYDVDAEGAREHVRALLQKLLDDELVVRRGE